MLKRKKIYKIKRKIAPKITLNRKLVVWRQAETKSREFAALEEIKKLIIVSLQKNYQSFLNKNLAKDVNYFRLQLLCKNWEINKLSSWSHIKNYCHYVGRARSVNKKLFMSRHSFRKFARFGMLPGFIKERV